MGENMTVTDELRRMLDECGVEWWEDSFLGEYKTVFDSKYGMRCCMYQVGNSLFFSNNLPVTPEQAVAVALGNDAKSCYATDYTHERCKYSVNRGWTEDTKFYIPILKHDTLGSGRVNEDSIDKWLREFQFAHGEFTHIGPNELKDLAYALHDDIPLGYEASMRLADWLLHATLGSGKLTTKQVEKVIRKYAHDTSCYIFEVYGEMCKFITDELNTMLGDGECEDISTTEGIFKCSNCLCTVEEIAVDYGGINYCPDCGKAVKR